MSIDDATPAEWDAAWKAARDEVCEKLEEDVVNAPCHYNQGNIQAIDAIQESMSGEAFRGYLKGNVQKYVWRYAEKNKGEDLRKARWYLDKLIEEVCND